MKSRKAKDGFQGIQLPWKQEFKSAKKTMKSRKTRDLFQGIQTSWKTNPKAPKKTMKRLARRFALKKTSERRVARGGRTVAYGSKAGSRRENVEL
jgi:hypothetical protein